MKIIPGNELLWEKFGDSAVRGYDRTVFRFAEKLADLTEKNMDQGFDLEDAISISWNEAIKKSGIPTDIGKDHIYEEMTGKAIEMLTHTWKHGAEAKRWFKEFIADLHF